MERSESIREFIRKKLDEKFDFSNEKARLVEFKTWCDEPTQKKAGFEFAKHRTLFTEQLKKVCTERNIDPTTFGLSRPKISFAQTSGQVTAEIKPQPKSATPQPQESMQPPQTTPTQPPAPIKDEDKIEIDEEFVEITFKVFFEGVRIKMKSWKSLSDDELERLGQAWLPLFKKYLQNNWGLWGLPILTTLGIIAERRADSKTEESESKQDKELEKKFENSDEYKDWLARTQKK